MPEGSFPRLLLGAQIPTSGYVASLSSLWTHRNPFKQPARNGNSHASGMSRVMRAFPKSLLRVPRRRNAGRIASKSGYNCPCRNCSRWPPAKKTVRRSLLNRLLGASTTWSVKGLTWFDKRVLSDCSGSIDRTLWSKSSVFQSFAATHDDDGFFRAFEDFGGRFYDSYLACAFLFFFFFFGGGGVPQRRSARAHYYSGEDQSTVASHSELRRLAECFLTKLHVSSFSWKVPTSCLHSVISLLWLRWVKSVCVFRCNIPPALLAEWPGSFCTPLR